jgi:hypothetical protein
MAVDNEGYLAPPREDNLADMVVLGQAWKSHTFTSWRNRSIGILELDASTMGYHEFVTSCELLIPCVSHAGYENLSGGVA